MKCTFQNKKDYSRSKSLCKAFIGNFNLLKFVFLFNSLEKNSESSSYHLKACVKGDSLRLISLVYKWFILELSKIQDIICRRLALHNSNSRHADL